MSLVASFFATACFAILYQIPKRALLPAGCVGLLAWLTLSLAMKDGATLVVASFAASFVGGVFSELLARTMKMPVTVFSVAGLVTLVPGTSAYAAMRYFVVADYTDGIAKATITLLAAVAIASGLVLSSTFFRLRKKN